FAVSPIPALRDIGTNSRVIAATQTTIDTSDIPPTSSPVFNLGDISPSKLVISAVRLSWPLHEYDASRPGFVLCLTILLIPHTSDTHRRYRTPAHRTVQSPRKLLSTLPARGITSWKLSTSSSPGPSRRRS